MREERAVTSIDFYLGTHMAAWLKCAGVPLFISDRRLKVIRALPRAIAPWALDSGGFTELSMHGRWTVTAREYAKRVRLYRDEIGQLEWAAVMDWMCEPEIIKRTGRTVADHQMLSLFSFIELRDLAPEINWLPVIQGWTRDDYLRHVEMYEAAGIDLSTLPRVGLGSVCRRQATQTARRLVETFEASYNFRIHGFGMKRGGIEHLGGIITSADSMAWSSGARYRPALDGCAHKHCGNCLRFALQWRASVLDSVQTFYLPAGCRPPETLTPMPNNSPQTTFFGRR